MTAIVPGTMLNPRHVAAVHEPGRLKGFTGVEMRRYLLIGATVALLAVPALAFGRATTTVAVKDNFFSPQTTSKTVGAGAIQWQWNGFGTHNVRQDVKLFYS